MNLPSRLLLITDRRASHRPLAETLTLALNAGCRWILLREKDLPEEKLLALAQETCALARPYGACISISENARVAAACQAHGIHLPQGSPVGPARQQLGKQSLIGASTHSWQEAQQAALDGADYILLSPIFPTPSKPGYGPPLGLDTLSQTAAGLSIPVIALGGITPHNANACRKAGAFGVAVMGHVMRDPAPGRVVAHILQSLYDQGLTL